MTEAKKTVKKAKKEKLTVKAVPKNPKKKVVKKNEIDQEDTNITPETNEQKTQVENPSEKAAQADEHPTEASTELQQSAKPLAKAGRRSAKAIEEAEEKLAKEERKKAANQEMPAEKPKIAQKPLHSRLERRGKKFREAAKLIDRTQEYPMDEALALIIKTSTAKFDATVEMHVNLGVDPRQADQNVRDTVLLPAGTGKTVRIAVFAEGDDTVAAKKAGADITGTEEITKLLDKEKLDFDILIATPTQMAKLGKYARLLGPRGLMPNPKSGTVTTDVGKAVNEAKGGRVEYRVDSTGIVHLGIGKVSFGVDKLQQNAESVLASIRSVKPASLKGNYIKAAFVTTTMGPSIKLKS